MNKFNEIKFSIGCMVWPWISLWVCQDIPRLLMRCNQFASQSRWSHASIYWLWPGTAKYIGTVGIFHHLPLILSIQKILFQSGSTALKFLKNGVWKIKLNELDFWYISNLNFADYTAQAVKTKFELYQKSSSSSLIFQIQFFRN